MESIEHNFINAFNRAYGSLQGAVFTGIWFVVKDRSHKPGIQPVGDRPLDALETELKVRGAKECCYC